MADGVTLKKSKLKKSNILFDFFLEYLREGASFDEPYKKKHNSDNVQNVLF